MGGFDDVSFQIVEEPEPPRRPRRLRRVALAAAAAALSVGALAAGASALTSSGAPAKAQQERHVVRFEHHGHHGPCPHMGGRSHHTSSAPDV